MKCGLTVGNGSKIDYELREKIKNAKVKRSDLLAWHAPKAITLENSILSYKGGKKILCTLRHERERKNDCTQRWPKSSTFAICFYARVGKECQKLPPA